MPPLRRSVRVKRTKAETAKKTVAEEEERFSTREKKRREIIPPHRITLPPAENKDLPSMVSGIWSDDSDSQLDATIQLLKLLSLEENPPIDEVIQSVDIPRLVEFLMREDNPKLQFEAARVLKNITSGTSEQTKMVIDSGAVPVFVKLLESSGFETREQAAWALGNIAGDSPGCRDIVLNSGAFGPLLTLLNEHKELSFLRIGTWTLSNFLEGKPELPFEQLESTIPILKSLIQTNDVSLIQTNDVVILKEACWALLHLSQCGDRLKSAMLEAGMFYKIARILVLHPPDQSVLLPAIRTLASLLSGNDPLDERSLGAKLLVGSLFSYTELSKCILKEASNLSHILEVRLEEFREKFRKKMRQGQL